MLKIKYAAAFTNEFINKVKQTIEEKDLTKFIKLFLDLFEELESEDIVIGFPFNFSNPIYYYKGNSNLFEFEDERDLEHVAYCMELTGMDSRELAEMFYESEKLGSTFFKYKDGYYRLAFSYTLPNMDKYTNPRIEQMKIMEL